MNVALIGNGRWGQILKRYIPNLFTLKYIANSKFNKNKIWKDKSVKAVIIATPMNSHYSIAKEALLNGKHIFVEKPITLRESEAIELKEIAEKENLQIGINYIYTFGQKLNMNLIDVNYDDIKVMYFYLYRNDHRNLDVHWTLSSHCLSVLDMIKPIDKIDFKFNNELGITFDKGFLKTSLKKMRMTYLGIITEDREIAFTGEQNGLKYSMLYFKSLIEGLSDSNIDRAIRITRVIENRI